MRGFSVAASFLLLASTVIRAAPGPDFWYVVPGETPESGAARSVRGIVVPATVRPTVRTTPAGSVLSWSRPDGTRQSFAVRGVSSFTFEPGPLEGTTYVPFGRRKHLQQRSDSCCACASWQNSEESIEALSCVVGCMGCGCEGCICSPTYPCPVAAPGEMVLSAHNGSGPIMRFGAPGATEDMTLVHRGGTPMRVRGRRLEARVNSKGETFVTDPDSISLSGAVATHASIRGDTAYFVWSSPDASVILEQPRSMPAPRFRDGVITFDSRPSDRPAPTSKRRLIEPVADRCQVCGHHPDSQPDNEVMACVPGEGSCMRCVNWECFTPES